MGCDGIYEFFNNQQVVDSINLMTQKGNQPLQRVAEQFLDKSLSPNVQRSGGKGCDNMSIVIIDFRV